MSGPCGIRPNFWLDAGLPNGSLESVIDVMAPPPSLGTDAPNTHEICLDPAHENLENVRANERMETRFDQTLALAKKHPWLTTALVAALFLFVACSYVTVQALLGHTTISLFHAHPELGAGMCFMTLYYGVYLLNLAKRARLKDELEYKIATLPAREAELRAELNAKFTRAKETLHELHNYSNQLIAARSTLATDGFDELIGRAQNTVVEGFTLIGREADETQGVELNLSFPEMERNLELSRSIGSKCLNLVKETGSFMRENPKAALMIFGGLLMCGLGGVALYHWSSGMTNAYFLGGLSLLTIMPMLGYGVCMLYEGYNRAELNKLERLEREMERATEIARSALTREHKRITPRNADLPPTLLDAPTHDWERLCGECKGTLDTLKNIYGNEIDLDHVRETLSRS